MADNPEIKYVLYNLTISEIEHALGDLKHGYSQRLRRQKAKFVDKVFKQGFGGLLLDEVVHSMAAQSTSALA